MSIVQRYIFLNAFCILQKCIGKEITKEIEHLFLTANAQRQYRSLLREMYGFIFLNKCRRP